MQTVRTVHQEPTAQLVLLVLLTSPQPATLSTTTAQALLDSLLELKAKFLLLIQAFQVNSSGLW